ncbi:hypothetical protein DR950_33830 [Kitasatospora xanthocidica]|uniref:Uncharacterized protein n=1 Tax=Kitasatospora xanthocidica TaxID=83382 RepID=A0A373A1N2_9ACTN|nr:hypothetical protein [Kitasatospora xanthocidica]RGD62066.1 hypothetical protein DR950_33830 [Kitasatospora xanthocidica]
MGRHANPVPAGTNPRLRALALALRRMKKVSGLTYAGLAARTEALGTPRGAATLSQAAAGHRLARLDTVHAFARAAADPADTKAQHQAAQDIRDLWQAAAIGRAAPLASELAPKTEKYQPRRTLDNLALGLRKMRARAGQPTLKALQDLSEAAGHRVAKSTIHLILAGRVLPTREQLAALLTAFDAAAGAGRNAVRSQWKWMALRDFIESRTRPAAPVRVTGYGCVDGFLDTVLESQQRKEEVLRKIGKLAKDEDEDEDEGEYRLGVVTSRIPWEYMDDDELAAMQEEAHEARETDLARQGSRDLLAELRALTGG